MSLNPDFRDLFAALNGAGAEYLLVGGYALAVHAAPPARLMTDYGGQPLPVIGKAHLVANKRASGRPQDLVDADALERSGPPR